MCLVRGQIQNQYTKLLFYKIDLAKMVLYIMVPWDNTLAVTPYHEALNQCSWVGRMPRQRVHRNIGIV